MPELEELLRTVRTSGDAWQSWRAERLAGASNPTVPQIPYQDDLGAFAGPSGSASPGGTGEGICHLVILGLGDSAPAVIAADYLDEVRTPAHAWLDRPEEVPGELETTGGARVWATAAATCGLLAVGRDPGPRALDLLRGESDTDGRFTGGAYPTFAAAGAFWLAEGPTTEIAEWALRWIRENDDDLWEAWDRATALTFLGAAGVPPDHPTIEQLLDGLLSDPSTSGDFGLALRTLELTGHFGAG